MTDYVDIARGWIDTPFHHQGRLPHVGLDCAGLVVCALAAVGITVRDVKGYARIPSKGQFIAMVREHCDPIEQADLARGDLLTFVWSREPQHIAIWTGEGIIHAYQEAGRVVEHDLDAPWQRRLRGCWRLKGGA